ncbi:hypothetical protein N4R57_04480 [Rhodobacteraceae bacterium D3-12]|nr:hypothetical protein N4R57_04480 [Rhodobacteraceae bacterium D3-12]
MLLGAQSHSSKGLQKLANHFPQIPGKVSISACRSRRGRKFPACFKEVFTFPKRKGGFEKYLSSGKYVTGALSLSAELFVRFEEKSMQNHEYSGAASGVPRTLSGALSIIVAIATVLALAFLLARPAGAQDIADLKARLANVGCYKGEPPYDDKLTLKFRTGVRCIKKKIGQDPTGEITPEVVDYLARVSAEIPPREVMILGVSEWMIERLLKEAIEVTHAAPTVYAGPVLEGVRASQLLNRIYLGQFANIPAAQRGEVGAAYAALLIEHNAMVRRYGPDCVYPGDTEYQLTQTQNSRTAFAIGTTEHYEQRFFAPRSHEQTARISFSAVGITPGINIMQDMLKVVNREGCRSSRTALLRENLYRYLARMEPSSIAQMKVRYPQPEPIMQAAGGAGLPKDAQSFSTSCLLGRRTVTGHGTALKLAAFCICFERHLRAVDNSGADISKVYGHLEANWASGYDRYRSEKLVKSIGSTCGKAPNEEDYENGKRLLGKRGIPLNVGTLGIR